MRHKSFKILNIVFMIKKLKCPNGLKLITIAAALALFLMPEYLRAQTLQDKYLKEGMYFFDGIEKIRQGELFTTYKAGFGLTDDDEMIPTNNVVMNTMPTPPVTPE